MVQYLVRSRIDIPTLAGVKRSFQALQRRGVGGESSLTLLGWRQSKLVEEHVTELLGGVEIEGATNRLVHLVLDAGHILAQFLGHLREETGIY